MPPRLSSCALRGLKPAAAAARSLARTTTTAPRRAFSASPASPSSDAPLLTVTRVAAPSSGHVRVIELNRPAARNAISRGMMEALRREFQDVAAWYDPDGREVPRHDDVVGTPAGDAGPARAVVLASAVDNVFCAGADLKERRGLSDAETHAWLIDLRSTFDLLESLPVPTIAAISSVALGGGLEMALAAHLRVLTANAVVGLPETRLAIIPGAGGTHRLPALVGLARARDLILTGRRVSAPEAYFLGIVDRLVEVPPADDATAAADGHHGSETPADADAALLARARRAALSEAVSLAFEICEGGPVAVRAALQAVQWARPEVAERMYERVLATDDRVEALRAFQEKRKPVFAGR
jgi:methylglutaconyl-CoA hydratase